MKREYEPTRSVEPWLYQGGRPIPVPPLRQAAALRFVRKYIGRWRVAPSREEIGQYMGITKVSAHLLLGKLEADGYIVIEPRKHRGITVTEKGMGPHWGDLLPKGGRRKKS